MCHNWPIFYLYSDTLITDIQHCVSLRCTMCDLIHARIMKCLHTKNWLTNPSPHTIATLLLLQGECWRSAMAAAFRAQQRGGRYRRRAAVRPPERLLHLTTERSPWTSFCPLPPPLVLWQHHRTLCFYESDVLIFHVQVRLYSICLFLSDLFPVA